MLARCGIGITIRGTLRSCASRLSFLIAYIKNSEYPFGAMDSEKKFIRCMACRFFLSGEVLYKRNHNSTLLQCVDASEANHLMEEMHEGLLGAHASGPLLAYKIMRAVYVSLDFISSKAVRS